MLFLKLSAIAAVASASALIPRQASSLDSCPGYTASNVQDNGTTVTADLKLAGAPCNTYGTDLTDLKLRVDYETGMHLQAPDIETKAY